MRDPTTTGQPAAASAQLRATAIPRRTRRAVIRSAHPTLGTSTTTVPGPAAETASSTAGSGSAAGGSRRSPAVAGTAGRGAGAGGSGRAGTLRSGEAARSRVAAGTAQRQAAHSASPITGAGGPWPETAASGRGSTPWGGSTPVSTTQPPTARPWRRTRTRVPTSRGTSAR